MPKFIPHTSRRGFTLIELLVVVAIIAVLIGILLPALNHMKTNARKAAASSQLNGLQMALQQYLTEFGVYPASSGPAYAGVIPAGRGAVMLAQGLMGFLPYAADGAGTGNPVTSTEADPPYGFRARQSSLGGKISGPYASADKSTFKVINNNECIFIDPWGNEILYYRALRPKADATLPAQTQIFGPAASNTAFFDQNDCTATTGGVSIPTSVTAAAPAFYQVINPTGTGVNSPVTGAVLGGDSFLLISAGPDGVYFNADDFVVGKP